MTQSKDKNESAKTLKYTILLTFPIMLYAIIGYIETLHKEQSKLNSHKVEHSLPKIGNIDIDSKLTGDAFSYIGKGHGGYFGVVNEQQFIDKNVSTVAYSMSNGGIIGTVRRYFDFDTKKSCDDYSSEMIEAYDNIHLVGKTDTLIKRYNVLGQSMSFHLNCDSDVRVFFSVEVSGDNYVPPPIS
jgi:hypothetical protein